MLSSGRVTPVTWTTLSQTAAAGTNVLYLSVPVNWLVGDAIVVATTGMGHPCCMTDHSKEAFSVISDLSVNAPMRNLRFVRHGIDGQSGDCVLVH